MAVILDKHAIAKYNTENNISKTMKIYKNHASAFTSKTNQLLDDEIREINGRKIRRNVTASTVNWEGTEAYNKLWNAIEEKKKKVINKFSTPDELKRNLTHFPSGAEDLFDLIRLDITRRTLAEPDITPFIANQIQRDDFTNPTNPQYLLEYSAPFKEFKGFGDPVNLVQTKTGVTASIEFTLQGVGFWQDLYNQLFNNIFDMQRVNAAVARGYVAKKNDNVMSPIINYAYPASKIVTAVAAGTFSLEQQYYDTFQKALSTLGKQVDPQTLKEINILNGLTLAVHSTRVRMINRAINGRIQNGDQVKNLDPIDEIARIIPYNGDTIVYGEESVSYSGIDPDKAYLFVPREYYYHLLKRDLTHVVGGNDAFGFNSPQEGWYFCDAIYNTLFFGAENVVGTKESGFIVEIELPADGT